MGLSGPLILLWRRDPTGFGAAIPIVIMYKKASLCKNLFLKKLAVCKRFCV